MATMTKLRAKHEQLIREMQAESTLVEKRIREFLAQIGTEYGLYGITYEIECFWEDGNSEDKIGLDPIVICNT